MSKHKLLIVLYNKNIEDSVTLSSLKEFRSFFGKFEIILWDNSQSKIDGSILDEYRKKVGLSNLIYIHTPENLGLSKIYNLVISEHILPSDHLTLLDDDSIIEPGFFKELYDLIADRDINYDILLPRILNNNTIVSPAKMYYFFGRYFKDLHHGINRNSNLVAINSGMTISAQYLKLKFEGYDERLKFYGTDTDFMKKATKNNAKIYILKTIIRHDLSFYNKNVSLDSKVIRINEMFSALKILFSRDRMVVRFFLRIYIIILKIRYCLQFKTIKFI